MPVGSDYGPEAYKDHGTVDFREGIYWLQFYSRGEGHEIRLSQSIT